MRGLIFNSLQLTKPKRNVFDLSHEKKLSMTFGHLVPIYLEHVNPGEKFRVRSEHLAKLAPMLAPVMHRVNIFTHWFFVPYRIIWDNYENFFTGGKDGKTFPSMPMVTLDETVRAYLEKGNLSDYLGIPPPATGAITAPLQVNALPFRAYQQIYNDYYRDNNLIDEIPFPKDDTQGDRSYLLTLRKRAFEKDYFTASLPDTQRGDDITIPTDIQYRFPAQATFEDGTPQGDGALSVNAAAGGPGGIVGVNGPAVVNNIEGFSSTINDLRTSIRLQEFLERSMRGGARYVEHVLNFFGVHSKDSRQMRAEFLGGGKNPVVISEVLSTFDGADTPGAQMYGHGVAASNNHGFARSFSEHGVLMGIMSAVPRTTYMQGIDKFWLKKDRYEFYYPQFAHLGEQEVLSKELYYDWQSITSDNDSLFGYVPRYTEYRYKSSSVHGDFRDELDFWHMARKFSNRPQLSEDFIQVNPDSFTRVFADTTANHKIYMQIYNDVKAIRPIPIFGTPKL